MRLKDKASFVAVGSWAIAFGVMALVGTKDCGVAMAWLLSGCCWLAWISGFQHGRAVGEITEQEEAIQ